MPSELWKIIARCKRNAMKDLIRLIRFRQTLHDAKASAQRLTISQKAIHNQFEE